MKHFSDLPVLIWNKNMDPFDLGWVAHRIITHDQQLTPGAEQNMHPGYVIGTTSILYGRPWRMAVKSKSTFQKRR